MSVPKSLRGEQRLHVHVELRRVAEHTLTKTRNASKFGSVATYRVTYDESGRIESVEERRSGSREALARRIEDAALGACECAWRANDIRVGELGEGWPERHALQEESVRHLDALLMLLNVARVACGLTGREVRYWSDITRDTRDLVRRWRDADRRRYAGRAPRDEGL
ncbi:MAG: hypothetical protein IKN60_04455 [Bacteroidales bacterium]|nr:hypothetical protein [Bacteroidales bacterium]